MIFNSRTFAPFDSFNHPMDDATYFDMVTKNSRGEVNKSVSVGQIFEISSATLLSDNMLVASGPFSPSISIKLNKERDFLKMLSITTEQFLESISSNNTYHVKIISVDSGLRGSFYEAQKDILRNEFFDQLKNHPTKVYDAKVVEKNRGGYFVNIHGVQAFLPGSLASANKIINFEAFLGKTISVMLDSYINESDTFIVSNKRYIEHIMPSLIDALDMSVSYEGIITGCIQSGIFVEFNEIMTGLLSQADMDQETLKLFKNGQIRPGDRINVWVRDIIPPKNFILTQNSTKQMIDTLTEISNIIESEDSDVATNARVISIKGAYVTLEFNNVLTTISMKGQFGQNNRLKIGGTIKIRIKSIDPKRNRIVATIMNDHESTN
jgi:ribosomal protein S1